MRNREHASLSDHDLNLEVAVRLLALEYERMQDTHTANGA